MPEELEFFAALRALRIMNGNPSLRVISKRAGVSHTHVANVLSTQQVPSWDVAQRLVLSLGGDRVQMPLWEDAWRKVRGLLPGTDAGTRPEPRVVTGVLRASDVMDALDRIGERLSAIEAEQAKLLLAVTSLPGPWKDC